MPVTFIAVGTKGASSSAATRTVALPAADAGDLFFVMISIASNATISTPSGWTKLQQTNSGASFTGALYWKIATGSDANPVFTWTGAVANTAWAVQFRGTIPSAIGTNGSTGSGTTNPHTSGSFNSTDGESLAVAFDFQASATAQPSTPAGWNFDAAQGGATSSMAFAVWDLQLGASGSASGAISQNQTAVAWFEVQYELLQEPLLGQICL